MEKLQAWMAIPSAGHGLKKAQTQFGSIRDELQCEEAHCRKQTAKESEGDRHGRDQEGIQK